MIKSVIIDDEKDCRMSLSYDIMQYCKDIAIAGHADGVKSGIELIQNVKPDLIFLDVQMRDGSGFDLLEHFVKTDLHDANLEYNFKVIFTTAFDQFAIKAIKFSALDYLLKPVIAEDLILAVEKFQHNTYQAQLWGSINVLADNRKNQNTFFEKLALNTGDSIEIFKLSEIVRCESESNYCMFYFVNQRNLLISRTLKEFDDMLSGHGFFRIHHSHLINMEHVVKFIRSEGGAVVMTDGSYVPVSRSKKEEFIKLISLHY